MTTAIIGTGGIGSAIARQLASGGETLRLSSADNASAQALAREIARAAVVTADNRDAFQGADAVVLALRFSVLKDVIDKIADPLTDKVVVVPSNPVGLDAQGKLVRLLPEGQPSGEVVAGWLPAGPTWRWRLERWRASPSSRPATGHRSRRSSSSRPTTTVPVTRSSG
jgi:predicted dinucleotide-binding enzyme